MRRFWGESISWPKNNIAEVTTEASILPLYLSWWNFTPQFLSFKSVCYFKKIKGNVSHYQKNCVSAHLSLFEEKKLEGGNPKSNTHTHTHNHASYSTFPWTFSFFHSASSEKRALSIISIQWRRPWGDEGEPAFLIKAPVYKAQGWPSSVGISLLFCTHTHRRHTRTLFPNPPRQWKMPFLSIRLQKKKKRKKKPTCHLTLWHFKSNVCFTWIWNSAHFSPGVLLAYSQVDSVSVPTGC